MAHTHRPLLPKSERALDQLKYEVAEDLGLEEKIAREGWGNMTTREVGAIGGHMVRRLIKRAEADLAHDSQTES
ncbi:small acid-soluble spore protein alpha/beta type [Sulfobacillus acidophilus TPY]|uniref:Small acid-soluble spore protein alpha/beta type n=1 Tax=Sulfobacillus acidophilus (strain ATCC 700253 / DSM 10332 / NAL) TaxID=679936 RepID=G8U1B7_SULAD|nr:small acid-soluble spore protein alpha/beta type [Sulfobacillus acidophilus TPY]AEW05437.1 small acid-soluble spore protein alpha/beta type [Sulfobacillus acidophilus DSM 10332]MCY0864118.1 alpha/beta-type small acid-soluble spore protein [Sulfobacillus sp.]